MPQGRFQNLGFEPERFEKKPLRIEVYDFLKKAITRGRLKPDQKLNEIDLARHLGISRTPIREALMQLEKEGLVTIDPGKGAIVSKILSVDLNEIYPIVSTLEGLAAGTAVPYMSPAELSELERLNIQCRNSAAKGASQAYMKVNAAFHQVFLDKCQNQRLRNLISGYKEQIFRFRLVSLSMPDRMTDSVKEHDRIISAFKKKDADLVERLVRQHVRKGGKALETLSDERLER